MDVLDECPDLNTAGGSARRIFLREGGCERDGPEQGYGTANCENAKKGKERKGKANRPLCLLYPISRTSSARMLGSYARLRKRLARRYFAIASPRFTLPVGAAGAAGAARAARAARSLLAERQQGGPTASVVLREERDEDRADDVSG